MINYGAPPAPNEIEITLFGPGYGEAIAVHLGEGFWFLVDSCLDPNYKVPASATYLDQIGVGAEQVHSIVASHWHDDHVRGISILAEKYSTADFVIPAVFNDKTTAAFVAAYNGSSSAGLARGARELYTAVRSRETVSPALHKSIVIDKTLNGRRVEVTALSPLPAAYAQSIARMAQFTARYDQAINNAPPLPPNLDAVALHIDLGDDAVLLGADLEDHGTLGWSAVVADKWSGGKRRATVYKVAHHGSVTGNCPQLWTNMLQPNPVACLTPFTNGKCRLPSDADKQRVKGSTQSAYISSGASRKPDMDSRLLKRVGDICHDLAQVNNSFGAIRLRRTIGAPSWVVQLFGAAQPL